MTHLLHTFLIILVLWLGWSDSTQAQTALPLNAGPAVYDDTTSFPGGTGTFYAAIGLQVLKPYFESNPTITIRTVTTAADGTTQTANQNQDYTYDFDVTPWVILGWVNENGLGARVGWWLYDHNADSIQLVNAQRPGDDGGKHVRLLNPHLLGLPSNDIAPGAREVWGLNNSMRFDVWDVALTQAVAVGAVDLVLGGGLRYAHMNQAVHEWYALEGALLRRYGKYNAGRSFNGIGPTVFVDARAPLSGEMGLSFYSHLHLGALFGRSADSDHRITYAGIAPAPVAPVTVTNTASRDGLLGFAEGEIGIEWAGQMEGFQPFLRFGLAGNVWHGVGNTQTPALPTSSTFGFFGYSILAGVNY